MLRFIHMSDTHIGSEPDFTLYGRNVLQDTRHFIQFLNEGLPFTPDFILHTGDVTNTDDDAAAKLAASVFATLKHPIRYVAGNHDGRAALRAFLLQQPRSDAPLYYDFAVEDFHFLVLDTRAAIDPQGYVSAEQLAWLAQTCADSRARSLVLVVHHLPLWMYVPWYDREMRIMNAPALFDALQPYHDRLRGVFFGHIHRAFSGFHRGVFCSATASTFMQFHTSPHDETFQCDTLARGGYAMVTLTHEQTIVTHHTIPRIEEES